MGLRSREGASAQAVPTVGTAPVVLDLLTRCAERREHGSYVDGSTARRIIAAEHPTVFTDTGVPEVVASIDRIMEWHWLPSHQGRQDDIRTIMHAACKSLSESQGSYAKATPMKRLKMLAPHAKVLASFYRFSHMTRSCRDMDPRFVRQVIGLAVLSCIAGIMSYRDANQWALPPETWA